MLSFAARQVERISRSKRNRLVEELTAYRTWANLFEMYPKVAKAFNDGAEVFVQRLLENYPDETPRLEQRDSELFGRAISITLLGYYLYGDHALSKFNTGSDKELFYDHVGALCGYLAADFHCPNVKTMAAQHVDCIRKFWNLKPRRDIWGVDVAVLLRALAPVKNVVALTTEDLRKLTDSMFGTKRNVYKETSDVIKSIVHESVHAPIRDIIVGNQGLMARHGLRDFPYVGGYALQTDALFLILSRIWGNNPDGVAMNRVYDIPAANLFTEWVRDVLYWVYNGGYYSPLPSRVLDYKNHMPYAVKPWDPQRSIDSKELLQIAVVASFTVYEKVGEPSTLLGYLPCYKQH